MSHFMNEAYYHTKEGCDNCYVIDKPLVYFSDMIGEVIVPEGFETDLASVPRLPIIYLMWGARVHREAIVHDYLYRSDSCPLVKRSVANSVFLEAIKSRGSRSTISYPMYWGVCIGGCGSFHKKKVGDKL